MDQLSTVIQEEFLTCTICFELFTKPKILPCLHNFCLECIAQHFSKNKKGVNASCPACRETFTVHDGKPDNLKTNFYINSLTEVVRTKTNSAKRCSFCQLNNVAVNAHWLCIECGDFLCNECKGHHLGTRITFSHQIISITALISGTYDKELRNTYGIPCVKHTGEVVKFYCETCSSAICRDCILLEHKTHACLTAGDAISTKRVEIEKLFEAAATQIESLVAQQIYFDDALSTVEQDKASHIGSLRKHGLSLKETIDQKIKDTEVEIRKVSEESRNILSTRKTDIGKQIETLTRPFKFCKDLLANGRDEEILYFQDTLKDGLTKHKQMEYERSNVTWSLASISVLEDVHRFIREEAVKCKKRSCTYQDQTVVRCDDSHKECQTVSTMEVVTDSSAMSEQQGDVDLMAGNQQPVAVEHCLAISENRTLNNTSNLAEEAKPKSNTTALPTKAQGCHSKMFELSNKFRCSLKSKRVLPVGIAWLRNQEIAICDSTNESVMIFSKMGELSQSFSVDKPTSIAVIENILAISGRSKVLIVENGSQKCSLSFPTGSLCRLATSLSRFLLFRNDITTVRMYYTSGERHEKDFPLENVVSPHAVSSNKKTILISNKRSSSVLMLNHKGNKVGEIKHTTESRIPGAHCLQDDNVILLDKQFSTVHILKNGEEVLEKWSTEPEIKQPSCLDYHQNELLVIGGACGTIVVYRLL